MFDAGPCGDCAGGGAGGMWMQRWTSTLSIVARGRRGGHTLHEWLVADGAHFLACWCQYWSVCVASGNSDRLHAPAQVNVEGESASGRWRDAETCRSF